MKKQILSIEVPTTISKSFSTPPKLDKDITRGLKNISDEPDYEPHNASFNVDIEVDSDANPWDLAHLQMERMITDKKDVSFIEPDLPQSLYDFRNREEEGHISKSFQLYKPDNYLDRWPRPDEIADDQKFVWHLQAPYSQLADARDWVMQQFPNRKITIGHFDTGVQSEHPAMPQFFKGGTSYIPLELVNDPEDKTAKYHLSLQGTVSYFQEQPGHGMATLAILAGNRLTKEHTGGLYEGYFGAIPQAEIHSYRICNTVALFGTSSFAKALFKAVDEDDCQVVTMSMGGGPSKRWAKAVNHAYMKGLTLVTAAGNSWTKGPKVMTRLPKRLIFPARWDRVIAATGVTASHMPYLYDMLPIAKAEGGHYMQGNYGPQQVMGTALAAYTPNTTWLTMNKFEEEGDYFTYQGGGTSSATPQVAAAAGLWLLTHQEKLEKSKWKGSWKQVEAVRAALFSTAKKPEEYMEYFGNGILQAKDALSYYPKEEELKMSKEAKVRFGGLGDTLGLLAKGFLSKRFTVGYQPNEEMLMLELAQLMHYDPELTHILDYDLDDEQMSNKFSQKDIQELKDRIIASEHASETLKKAMKTS